MPKLPGSYTEMVSRSFLPEKVLGTCEVPVFLIAAFSDNGLRERKGTTGITQRCYYHCPVLCLFETAVISTEMNRQVARGPGKKNRDLQSTRLLTPGPV